METTSRDRCLDRLRGLAVIGMILVVSPGSWSHRLTQLDHAVWNGCTAADIVMPMFLLCVGMAIPLSSRAESNFYPVVRRTVILITLGVLINLLPDFDTANLRIPGVLQRIGVCYFIGATAYYVIRSRANLEYPKDCLAYGCVVVLILLANYIVMHHLSISVNGSEPVSGQGAVSAYVDQTVFGVQHLWQWAYVDAAGFKHDPDGILSTLFASSAVVMGFLLTNYRRHTPSPNWRQPLSIGVVMVISGLLIVPMIPINKVIWSVSFSLHSVGIAIIVLALLELGSRHLPDKLFLPLDIVGSNAILAFLTSSVLLAYHGVPLIAGESPQAFLFGHIQTIISEPYTASLICAVIVASFILLLLYPLYVKRLFFRL